MGTKCYYSLDNGREGNLFILADPLSFLLVPNKTTQGLKIPAPRRTVGQGPLVPVGITNWD